MVVQGQCWNHEGAYFAAYMLLPHLFDCLVFVFLLGLPFPWKTPFSGLGVWLVSQLTRFKALLTLIRGFTAVAHVPPCLGLGGLLNYAGPAAQPVKLWNHPPQVDSLEAYISLTSSHLEH